MEQLKIIIKDEANKTMFENFIKAQAESLSLKGYVKIVDDGDIRIEAQGDGKDLIELVDQCKSGLGKHKVIVKSVNIKEKYTTFEVKH